MRQCVITLIKWTIFSFLLQRWFRPVFFGRAVFLRQRIKAKYLAMFKMYISVLHVLQKYKSIKNCMTLADYIFNWASNLLSNYFWKCLMSLIKSIYRYSIRYVSVGYLNLCMCVRLFTVHILVLTVVIPCVLCVKEKLHTIWGLHTVHCRVVSKMVIWSILKRTTLSNHVFIQLTRWAGRNNKYHLLHNGAFIL